MNPAPQSNRPDPLQPAAGGLNCIVGERSYSTRENIMSRGELEKLVHRTLAKELGAAIVSLAEEQPRGTLEIQLTREDATDEQAGITTSKWRVDVWKARQRQFVRVKVQRYAAEKLTAGFECAPSVASDLGQYACPHCGQEGRALAFTHHKLPAKMTLNCRRCTLPVGLLLVDAEAKP